MVYYQLTKYDANSDIQILDLNGFINNMSRRNGSPQNDWYKHKYALKWIFFCDTTVVVHREMHNRKSWRGESLRIYISTSFWRRFNPFLTCKSCEPCESTEKRAMLKAGEENHCESTSLQAFCNGFTHFCLQILRVYKETRYIKCWERITANLHLYKLLATV